MTSKMSYNLFNKQSIHILYTPCPLRQQTLCLFGVSPLHEMSADDICGLLSKVFICCKFLCETTSGCRFDWSCKSINGACTRSQFECETHP